MMRITNWAGFLLVCVLIPVAAHSAGTAKPPTKSKASRSAVRRTPRYRVVKSRLPKGITKSQIHIAGPVSCIRYRETLADVLANADAIVVGTPTQEFVYGRAHYALMSPVSIFDKGGESLPLIEWTDGAFRVESVLSGTAIQVEQVISVSEPVGLMSYGAQGVFKSVIENCYELKQNSRYVLFLKRKRNGKYQTFNANLGRFNTDGTDAEDEVTGNTKRDGSKSFKQMLRDELTAAYGVTFAVPNTAPLTIMGVGPSGVVTGNWPAFTLTVSGTGFKNGAVIKFGGTDRQTTFVSATRLTAPIQNSDIAAGGGFDITVTNPDEGTSASFVFWVDDLVATGSRFHPLPCSASSGRVALCRKP